MQSKYLSIKIAILVLSLILLVALFGMLGIRYYTQQATPELKQATLYPPAARHAINLNLVDQSS